MKTVAKTEPANKADSFPTSFSDGELASRFSARHALDLRYTARLGRWNCWDAQRWAEDDTLAVYDLARDLCCEISTGCDLGRAHQIYSAQTIAAVERIARADRRHAAVIDQWDADIWSLNTPDGIVNLTTGQLRPARREAYCTKMARVGPKDEFPERWWEFLLRV